MIDALCSLWRRELPDLTLPIIEEDAPYPSLVAGEADAVAVWAEVPIGELPEGVTGFRLPRTLWSEEGEPP